MTGGGCENILGSGGVLIGEIDSSSLSCLRSWANLSSVSLAIVEL